jgi:hypothetical protein
MDPDRKFGMGLIKRDVILGMSRKINSSDTLRVKGAYKKVWRQGLRWSGI